MKHIVIDARELRTSTGRYVERLVHYLQQIDNQNKYTILLYPKDMDGWEPSNPNFTKVPCPHKEFTFDEQIGLKRQLDHLHPDLVHFAMVQQPVLYKGKTVTTMQDLTGIRFRNPTKHWLIFTIKQLVYKWVNKRVADKSDALITPTEFVRQDVAAYTGVSPDKITVTHESVDDFSEPAKTIKEFVGKDFIMFNGRPLPHKNLKRLIEAFGILHQKYPHLYLMIAGKKDASHKDYLKLADKLGLTDKVILTGWVTDGQLKWAMQHAKVYAWASLSEGFGLPPLEAMLNGAPVASSNFTCMPEVIGDAANYFNPTSVRDIARAIEEIIENPALQQKLIAAGRKQVKKYSWKQMARQTLTVYESVLNSKI